MTAPSPVVTTEVSMYPLSSEVEPPIIAFIKALRTQPGIDIVTNAMSTQLTGAFADVHRALAVCMEEVLRGEDRVVFVTKTLNTALDIHEAPDLG